MPISDDEMLRFPCGNVACRKSLKAPPSFRGKACRCSRCGAVIAVPLEASPHGDDDGEVNVVLVADPLPLPPPQPTSAFAFDFTPEPPPRPRLRRANEERSPRTGLLIALLVLVALGVGIGGWFLWVSVRNERDKQRLADIEAEAEGLLRQYVRVIVLDAMIDGLQRASMKVRNVKSEDEFKQAFRTKAIITAVLDEVFSKRAKQPDAIDLLRRMESLGREHEAIAARHPDWHPDPAKLARRPTSVGSDFESRMDAIVLEIDGKARSAKFKSQAAEVQWRLEALIGELRAGAANW